MGDPTPYADYPNPEAKDVTLYLSKNGNKVGGLQLEKTKKGKESL